MTIMYLTMTTTFMMALIGVVTNRAHLMSILLCMEAMTLAMFLSMATLSASNKTMVSLPLTMITLSACEAAAGLSLMTITSQKNTNDHMKNLNLLKC